MTTHDKLIFWKTRKIKHILECVNEGDALEWLIDSPTKGQKATKDDINKRKLNNPNLVIYQVRFGLRLAGVVFFTMKDSIAQVDVSYKKWCRGHQARSSIEPIIDEFKRVHKIYDFYGNIKEDNLRSLQFSRWAKFKQVSHKDGIITVERHG